MAAYFETNIGCNIADPLCDLAENYTLPGYLKNIANQGGKPGKFAELLNYAQGLAASYTRGGIDAADRFAGVSTVNRTPVTGRAYSWMTDRDCYKPGGNFVAIPDALGGSPGGNRFYTLRKEPK